MSASAEPSAVQGAAGDAPWLLLTASVDPLGCKGAMFSPESRLRQYLGAFRFFLRFFRRHPDLVRGIVLAENSGASPEPFRACAEAVLPPGLLGRVECVFFPPDGFLPEKGKSYNEMRLIGMALGASRLVGRRDAVLKLTGRYPLRSLGRDLRDLAAASARLRGVGSRLEVGYWPWPRLRSRFNRAQLPLVDTRRIAFRASAWEESFSGAWRTADNSAGRYFESIVHEIVESNRSRPGWTRAFSAPPLVLAPPGHRKYLFGRQVPAALGRMHSLCLYLYLRAISGFAGQ